jgi:hypothetical protein
VLSEAQLKETIAKLKANASGVDFTKLRCAAVELRPAAPAAPLDLPQIEDDAMAGAPPKKKNSSRELATAILNLNRIKGKNVPLCIRSYDISLILDTLDVIKKESDGDEALHARLIKVIAQRPVALPIWLHMFPKDLTVAIFYGGRGQNRNIRKGPREIPMPNKANTET